MLPYIESHELTLGPLVIHTWGLAVSVGIVLALWVAFHEAKRQKVTSDLILDASFWSLVGAFVGARLGYVLNEWSLFRDDPVGILRIWEGGMASWGGIAGVVVALVIIARHHRVQLWTLTDLYALAAPLGLMCGRVGCSLIHDHIGRETDVPWGVEMPDGTIRHEPSYYLVLFNLVLFAALYWAVRKHRLPQGYATVGFLVVYGLGRLFVDTFRANDLPVTDPRILDLTVAQYLFIAQIFVGLGLYLYLRRHRPAIAD